MRIQRCTVGAEPACTADNYLLGSVKGHLNCTFTGWFHTRLSKDCEIMPAVQTICVRVKEVGPQCTGGHATVLPDYKKIDHHKL